MGQYFLFLLLTCSFAFAQLPESFFMMSTGSATDMPLVPYGSLGHGPLVWTAVEGGGRGVYNFKEIDIFVKKAPRINGVAQINLTLGLTPSWAVAKQSTCHKIAGGISGCTAPPENIQDWINFVTELVNHYNGVTAPHVRYYEIWNEANTVPFWTGSVAQLAALGAAAYPILKQDPNSSVLTASVIWQSATGPTFQSQYLALAPADAVTFHAYTCRTGTKSSGGCAMPESASSSNAPLQQMIPAFASVANGLPLLATEGSWGVNGVTDPDLQQAWIAHYVILAGSYAQTANIAAMSWFEWGKPGIALSGNIEQSTGQPTAAGLSYGVVQGWLAEGMQPCLVSGTIWSCTVGANLIVWDPSQTCSNGVCTTSSYPATSYSQYADVTGTIYPIQNGTVALGIKPLLLQP